MAEIVRGKQDDEDVKQVLAALNKYETDHPGSVAEVYRQNDASIRIRIIDDRFARMSIGQRHDDAWKYIEPLSDDVQEQITLFLLLPKSELPKSFMNQEFEHPVASGL